MHHLRMRYGAAIHKNLLHLLPGINPEFLPIYKSDFIKAVFVRFLHLSFGQIKFR